MIQNKEGVMAQYGHVISKHRKLNNLTQSQLADKLFVSPQAISKWEKNQSEPDLSTIKKLAELFNISVDEFFEAKEHHNQPIGDVENKDACSVCLNHYEASSLISRDDVLVCLSCSKELDEEENFFETFESNKPKGVQIKGLSGKLPFYVGLAVGIILLIVFITAYFVDGAATGFVAYLGTSILISLLVMTFMTQMLYDSWLRGFLSEFIGRSIQMPGIIFELSIDGLIWLILTKIFLGLIVLFIGLAVFLFGL